MPDGPHGSKGDLNPVRVSLIAFAISFKILSALNVFAIDLKSSQPTAILNHIAKTFSAERILNKIAKAIKETFTGLM